MKKSLYIPALLLLAACNNHPKDKAAQLAELKKQRAELNSKISELEASQGGAHTDTTAATDVNTITVQPGNFTNYIQIQGKIDAQDNVTAFPQAPGTITSLYVKSGQHVSRGQLLAQLDNSVLKQNIAQAEAQATLNRTLYQRQKNLWDQKIGTEVQFLQAQTALQSAEKQVAALRQQANLYRIISPINGTVDQMDLKLGQVAQPGQTGIRIVNADNLKVKADVPESYASRVYQGANVNVVFPDANDSLNAKLTFVAKVIDPLSRSFATEVKLPARKNLRPNMTAVIKIADYVNNKALTVPLNAIQKSESGSYLFVAQNGIAKRKEVKVGNTYGGKAEILSGLNSGDQVITAGAADLEDGNKVKVSSSGL